MALVAWSVKPAVSIRRSCGTGGPQVRQGQSGTARRLQDRPDPRDPRDHREPQGLQGPTGAQGPSGSQGLSGRGDPPDPLGRSTVRSRVDRRSERTERGCRIRVVQRAGASSPVGNDAIVFFASVNGPTAGPIDFYHATTDCSDGRYIPISAARASRYFAAVRGGTAFYTKTVDPTTAAPVPIVASEHFDANEDATQPTPGNCNAAADPGPVGALTTTSDPALLNLALPLRLK